MRLVDLEPQWLSLAPDKTHRTQPGVGVSFHCPACHADGRQHRIGVMFLNTLDAAPSVPPTPGLDYDNEGVRWVRQGLTFEDLTLSPSLNLGAHWHGHVYDGEVTTC